MPAVTRDGGGLAAVRSVMRLAMRPCIVCAAQKPAGTTAAPAGQGAVLPHQAFCVISRLEP